MYNQDTRFVVDVNELEAAQKSVGNNIIKNADAYLRQFRRLVITNMVFIAITIVAFLFAVCMHHNFEIASMLVIIIITGILLESTLTRSSKHLSEVMRWGNLNEDITNAITGDNYANTEINPELFRKYTNELYEIYGKSEMLVESIKNVGKYICIMYGVGYVIILMDIIPMIMNK